MASFPGQKSTGPALPNPVFGLTATVVNAGQINLSWNAVANATGYNLFRGGTLISSPVGTSLADTTVAAATAYSYTVQAVNAIGGGVMSAPASATTPPAQVTGLTATAVSSSSIGTAWTATAGASSYTVDRGGTPVGTSATNAFVDTGLTPGTAYTYTVAANGAGGQGAFSGPATATTQAASTTLRNNAGWYGCFDYAGGVNSSRFTSGDQGIINSVATGTTDNLMGFSFIIAWRAIDKGTTAANFDWSVVDQYANACRAKGKHWWCWLSTFFLVPGGGSSCSTGAKTVPDWVYNQSVFNCQGNMLTGGGVIGGGVYPKFFASAVQTALTQLFQAFVTRYESDPLCEGLIFNIGSSIVVANQVDNLGTKQPNINYDSNYSDAAMKNAYITFMQSFRSMTSILNLHMSLDYMFWHGDSNPQNWIDMLNAVRQYQCIGGGPDCLTKNWVYPNATPAITGSSSGSTFCLTPQPDARFAVAQTPGAGNNSCFNRGVSSDQYYVGWKGFPAYKGLIKWGKTQELTEMGGYIGQFSAADCWETSGPKLYNVSYQHFDVNYSQSGNYGTNPAVTSGAPKAPNTLWAASTSYETTYGISVYTYIKNTPFVAPVNPYP